MRGPATGWLGLVFALSAVRLAVVAGELMRYGLRLA